MGTGFNTRPIGGGEYEVDLTVDGTHEGTWTVEDDEQINLTSTESVSIYLNGDYVTNTTITNSGYVQVDDFVNTVDYRIRLEDNGDRDAWISQDFDFDPPICAFIIDIEAVSSGGGAAGAGIGFSGGETQPKERRMNSGDSDEDWYQSYTHDTGGAVARVGGFSGENLNPLEGQGSRPTRRFNAPYWFSDIFYSIEDYQGRRTNGEFNLEMDYVEGSYSFPNL